MMKTRFKTKLTRFVEMTDEDMDIVLDALAVIGCDWDDIPAVFERLQKANVVFIEVEGGSDETK